VHGPEACTTLRPLVGRGCRSGPSSHTSAFKATGIWPRNRTVVTKRFDYSTPPNQTDISGPSHLSPADWRRIERLLKAAVQEGTTEVVQKLPGAINRASTENKLLKLQNEGLLASLDTQNKRTRNGQRLPLKGKKKQRTDATFFTPRQDDEKLEKAAQIKDNKIANKKKKEVRVQGTDSGAFRHTRVQGPP
jgi:hypothetical protein